MSGASKKSGRRMSSQKYSNNLGDVTLNDFANSALSKGQGRLKKAAVNNIVREVKQLSVETDDRAWFDKLEDFEGDFEFVEEENEDGSTVVVKRAPRRRGKTISEEDVESTPGGGVDYPLDIWFLVSEFVRPEDVGTFAGICRGSLQVTLSAKFWYGLFRRHYRTVPNLPERLQPECMMRLYGLRACVVRALHFMYPPFVSKTKSIATFEGDPHSLTRRQCVLMWHEKRSNNSWLFYFKLKSASVCFGHRPLPKPRQPDLLEMLEDVSANQDEGCKVLQVTCPQFNLLPMVLGLTLCSVSMNLSHGLRHHRLQLGFGSGHACYTAGKQNVSAVDGGTILVLDPVANVRVLDWWHPLYPHATNSGFNIQIPDSDNE